MGDDWNSHWKAYSASNALNPAQSYRQKLIFDALGLERAPASVRLLDLGCGNGELLAEAALRRPGLDVMGLDLAERACELAREKFPKGRFYAQNFAAPLTVPKDCDGFATHVVCTEVLEHLDDPAAALRNVRRLMAPRAKLVVTVPGGPMSAFDKHIGHRGHFTRTRLKDVIEQAGFAARVDGAGAPFFNLYRLVVVARGERLIADAGGDGKQLPLSAKLAMRAFDTLFKFNAGSGRFGWQLVAVAEAS
jgi:SAM-dependent methyltransferase